MDDIGRRLWKYYKNEAEIVGVEDYTENPPKEYGYSLWGKFYKLFDENNLENELNDLCKAFLKLGEIPVSDGSVNIQIEKDKEEIIELLRNRSRKPNPSQISAIAAAINNTVTIIEGPPGTGKTETISNLLRVLLRKNKEVTIAVVSSNNEAVRNIIDSIEDLKGKYAELGNAKKRESFFESELKEAEFEADDFKKEDCIVSKYGKEKYRYDPKLLKKRNIIFSTIHSLNICIKPIEHEKVFQYDYVIIDECSQVSNMLGVVAMAAARHLVLFGDTKQLPPINKISKKLDKNKFAKLDELPDKEGIKEFKDKDDNSFMKSCSDVFCNKNTNLSAKLLLNEHYRCHPGIIEFCNRRFYEKQLDIKTKDDGLLPIRVRYYDGNYYERTKALDYDAEDKAKNKIYNKKQILIFMKEEYPKLIERMKENSELSVCVISPYRYELELLEKQIKEYNSAHGIKNDEIGMETTEEQKADSDFETLNKVPCLTVHKVQGRGYDVVFFLPVEEGLNDKEKWSQRDEMFNVMVSRAKKELCVICAAEYLPKKITGKERCDNKCNLAQLSDYVINHPSYDKAPKNRYGFFRSEMSSVFDNIPDIPIATEGYKFKYEKKSIVELFSPEIKVAFALCNDKEIMKKYDVFVQVPIKDIELNNQSFEEEETSYISKDSHFDMVICNKKQNKIELIIEIDGSYHRKKETKNDQDVLKDKIVAKAGLEILDFIEYGEQIWDNSDSKSFSNTIFTRIPTDGTTIDELYVVKKILDNNSGLHFIEKKNWDSNWKVEDIYNHFEQAKEELEKRKRSRKNIINGVREKLKQYYDFLKSEFAKNEQKIKDVVAKVNKTDYNYANFSELKYYLLKYSLAYLFDYSVIYRLIIENMEIKGKLSVVSIGCGSCIDYLGLKYAVDFTGYDGGFDWKGYDPSDVWSHMLEKEYANEKRYWKKSAQDYFERDVISENVIIFPRSFGDIVETNAYRDMICAAENCKYNSDEMFICIAHVNDFKININNNNKTAEHYEKSKEFIEHINKVLIQQGFEKKNVTYQSIPMLCTPEADEKVPGYLAFENQWTRISNIDCFFSNDLIEENIKWVKDINEMVKQDRKNPITTVNFSNYQILHFVRNSK